VLSQRLTYHSKKEIINESSQTVTLLWATSGCGFPAAGVFWTFSCWKIKHYG